MRKIVITSLCLLVMLFSLTGCQNKSEKGINDKLDSELRYFENLMFKIANKHAKGEYIEDDKINWDDIKNEVGKINSSWNNLVLDLTVVKVQNQDIVEFSNYLNDAMLSVKNKNEVILLNKINAMYEKIVVFRQAYSNNQNENEKKKLKSNILKIYTLANRKRLESRDC